MLKFSIIIPVRKINDYVKESISHIKELDYQNYEVFVVTDENDEYDFSDPRIKILVSGKVGPGEKRNMAAKVSEGDILAFLDDDSYPEKNWLSKAAKVFEDSDVYALGGPAATPKDAEYLERMAGWFFESYVVSGNTTYRYRPEKKMLVDDYPTVNLFVKRSVFEEIGGFTKDFWPGEDTKLCLDMVKKFGRKFPYDPEVLVYHHRRNIFKPYLKQISRYGRYRGRFSVIFPETSRVPMYFVPPAFVLFLFGGIIISLLFPPFIYFYIAILIIYFYLLWGIARRISKLEGNSTKALLDSFKGIFLTHLFYGTNFLIGMLSKPELKLKEYDKKTGNYIGG